MFNCRRIETCALIIESWQSIKCARCRGVCCSTRSDIHTAGSPCQDFSVQGKGEGWSGKRATCFWVRHLRHLIVIHENVCGFGKSECESLLGDLYYIIRVETEVVELGWPEHRKRQLLFMLLKRWSQPVLREAGADVVSDSGVESFLNIQAFIDFAFTRRAVYHHVQFARASPEAISAEIVRVSQRASVAERYNVRAADTYKDAPGSAAASLNTLERRRVAAYAMMFPGDACDAMQTPKKKGEAGSKEKGHTTRSRCRFFFTLARGMGLIWEPRLERWYLMSELLESMGFPTVGGCVRRAPVGPQHPPI